MVVKMANGFLKLFKGDDSIKVLNLKGVSRETWIRTIVMLIAFANQLLVTFGKTSKTIEIDDWFVYVSYVFTAATAVRSWWKNNSFTNKAQEADKFLRSDDDERNI